MEAPDKARLAEIRKQLLAEVKERALTPPPADTGELGRFKSGKDIVRIESTGFNGKSYINIRSWYLADNGQLRPGKNGFTLGKDKAKILHQALSDWLSVQPADQAIE